MLLPGLLQGQNVVQLLVSSWVTGLSVSSLQNFGSELSLLVDTRTGLRLVGSIFMDVHAASQG